MIPIKPGSTSQSIVIRIVDSTTGIPEQAVEHNTAGVALWYRREGAAKVAITPAALAALDTEWTSGGIEHIDDGYYRLDVPDAAFAAGVDRVFIGGAFTDMIVMGQEVVLSLASKEEISTQVWAEALIGTKTAKQIVGVTMAAFAAGKLSGAGTATITIRDTEDGFNAIVMTVDTAGNRSAVTLNFSA